MKAKKTPTYQMTFEQIEKERKTYYDKGLSEAAEKLILVPIMVLRDKFGFGATRIERFIDYYKELFVNIDENRLDINDIIKAMDDELGIRVEMKND